MKIVFEAFAEDVPGDKWRRKFDRHWHAYSRWFLRQGIRKRASYLDGLRAIEQHMPELVKPYTLICEAAGGGDLEARFLSMWCPPAYVGGCSQVILPGAVPSLLRNYDFSPELFEGTWLRSRLTGRSVIAVVDCLWGVLDGMNEDGLAVSLAFGGRTEVGKGFGIPIVLRYLLECAGDVKEAVALLRRVPVHMSYSVALIDRGGASAMVYVVPDREPEIVDRPVATNHQHKVEWQRHATATASVEREAALESALKESPSEQQMIETFRRPPVYQTGYREGYGTIYTSLYRPDRRDVSMIWPNRSWVQSFDQWKDGEVVIEFGSANEHPPAPGFG